MAPSGGVGVRLSWIVVAHESRSDLGLFLPSLVPALADLERSGFSTELLVVDNASSDGTPELVRRLAPRAQLVRCAANRGFGAAANRGADLARGAWLAVGNSDLCVPGRGLVALPRILEGAAPEIAVLGPALADESGALGLSAGRFPTLASLITGLLRPCHRRKYLAEGEHRAGDVDWVTGACLFVRADAFRAADGFDERFFLYYEDVDLARRLRAGGHRVVYEPRLSVVHLRPHHGRPPRPDIEEIVRRSRAAYFEKHRPRWESALLGGLTRLEPLVRRRARVVGPPVPSTIAPAVPVARAAALAPSAGLGVERKPL